MNIPLILLVLIDLLTIPTEARKKRVNLIPYALKKDLWMTPKDGILVTENTPVYRIKEGRRNRVMLYEIPNTMQTVANHLLKDEKYQRASADNINNPLFYPVMYEINSVVSNISSSTTISTAVPESVPGNSTILYPKILVVVANDLYTKLGNKMRYTIPYILAFWNGVDMMYRSIENPKIRFHIAGIVLETDNWVLDYLRSDPIHYKYIDGAAMHDAKEFWYNHRDLIPLESYDNVVTMTARSLCVNRYDDCNELLEGRSWPDSMCMDAPAKGETNKVTIIQDNGMFSGILPATAELGHALGIKDDHDETFKSEEELKNLPNCRNVSSGYIMDQALSPTIYAKRWSQCSLDQLKNLLEDKNHTCLYVPPKTGELHIPRLLPGKLVTLDQQCRAYGYYEACQKQLHRCQFLECVDLEGDDYYCYDETEYNALEGTPCSSYDPNKFCMFGRCIKGAVFT